MIAFTADNHLGVESQWSIKERKGDFLSAFSNAVSATISSADALILGGDLFDTAHPPAFAVEHVQNEIRRLQDNEVRVYGIDGNHDLSDGQWLRVCGITPLSDEPVLVDGHTVCGIGYGRSGSVLETLERMVDRGVSCEILVLHLAFGDLNRMGATSDLSSRELLPVLKALGTKLVLMGHIHIRQQITLDGITFAYCGSTELCSMNEPKDKSLTLVDEDLSISAQAIATRNVESSVIGNEKEFARYEASVEPRSRSLQAVFIGPDVQDGVRRLRELAREKGLMMRIQTIQATTVEKVAEIDRTTGIIGLEQAIGLSFNDDSEEASLIRAIIRSPESMKTTVENYMKG